MLGMAKTSGQIHNGSFSGELVTGDGVTTALGKQMESESSEKHEGIVGVENTGCC